VNIDSLTGHFFRWVNRRYLCFPEATVDTCLPPPNPDRRYLLYIHIPYCVVLCPFCSFHRVKFNKKRAQKYFRALHHEIELVTDAGYRFDELYVGGGTPTVLPDELIGTIGLVRSLHSIKGISVETNPDHLANDRLLQLQEAGVNRISVGVQSFDNKLLREMGRFENYGSGSQIRSRLRRATGILDTLNVDIIYNFPHQTAASLRRDLDILVDELGVDQVSFYPLMSANSTRKMMRNTVGRVDHSRERNLYKMIAERMLAAGYTRSSAWCFSQRPGMSDEYIAGREEYLGLGSGSFSYLQGSLYASTFSINQYLLMLEADRTGTAYRRDMLLREQMRYYLLMELFGGSLDKAAAEARFEGRFQRTMWTELAALRAIGAIRDSAGVLMLTGNGYYLWALLMREFLTGVNGLRDQMRHNIAHAMPIQPPTGARF